MLLTQYELLGTDHFTCLLEVYTSILLHFWIACQIFHTQLFVELGCDGSQPFHDAWQYQSGVADRQEGNGQLCQAIVVHGLAYTNRNQPGIILQLQFMCVYVCVCYKLLTKEETMHVSWSIIMKSAWLIVDCNPAYLSMQLF